MSEQKQDGLLNGKAGIALGSTGLLGLAGTIIWSQITLVYAEIETTKKDAGTALQVVAQHGKEFNLIRDELTAIRSTLSDLRAQLNLGGRFTKQDGDDLRTQLRELRQQLLAVEREQIIASRHTHSPE